MNTCEVGVGTSEITSFPLLFELCEVVVGQGFVAEVRLDAGALAVGGTDGWWLYGVNPGGIAEPGETLREAHAKLLHTFRAYLMDVADEADGFKSFRSEVLRFYRETNEPTREEWESALKDVRAGRVKSDLPRMSADEPRTAVVRLLEPLVPTNTIVDDEPTVAA